MLEDVRRQGVAEGVRLFTEIDLDGFGSPASNKLDGVGGDVGAQEDSGGAPLLRP